MISLNLNSPYQKKEIRLNRFYYLLKNSLGLVIIISLAAAIILLTARNNLQENFNTIVAEASLINQQIQGSNQKIVIINEQLAEIDELQNQFVPWSNLIVELIKNLPPNIKINFLIIQPDQQIIFKGLAKYRNDFLSLKDKLEKIKFLEKVEAPLSQLTKKENIEFEMKASVSLETIHPVK